MENEFFLEAHYYAGGLRHRFYAQSSDRPTWAGAADSVGFTDEFPLTQNTAAVELKRIEKGNQRLTWLAVYHPSVDSRLGDRSNHAGVGVWLNELTVIDPRSLVHGLDLLSQRLAESVDADALETNALEFLVSYLPKYVRPLSEFEQFEALPFAGGKLARTSFAFLSSSTSLGDCAVLGDHILSTLFVTAPPAGASRELICISPLDQPPADGPSFRVIADDEDYSSQLLKKFPAATDQLRAELERSETEKQQISAEAAQLKERLDELSGMEVRIKEFEADPLSTVLSAVRDLDRKMSSLSGRVESPRPAAPVRSRSPVSTRDTPAAEPEYEYNWFFIGFLASLVVLLLVLAYFAITTWLF